MSMLLCACYALYGTSVDYAPTHLVRAVLTKVVLRRRGFVLSRTGVGYAATSLGVTSAMLLRSGYPLS
eukprot:2647863-Rhodomonas_salina.1